MGFLIWGLIILLSTASNSLLMVIGTMVSCIIYYLVKWYFKADDTHKYIDLDYIKSNSNSESSKLNNQGIELCYREDFENGIQMLDMAIAINPDFHVAKYNLSIASKRYKIKSGIANDDVSMNSIKSKR